MDATMRTEEETFAAVKRPVAAIRSMYTAQCSGDHAASRASIRDFFARSIGSQATMQLVPCLTPATADLLGDQSLVRVRGMVQDVLNPEMFVGAFKDPAGAWQTTQWSDNPPPGFEQGTDAALMERVPLYITPVPGCTPWAEARWTGHPCKPSTPRVAERPPVGVAKRGRDQQQTGEPAAAADADTHMQVDQQPQQEPGKRRTQQQPGDAAAAGGGQPPAAGQGQQQEAGAGPAATLLEPLCGDCIAYAYEEDAAQLHDVVEVLGVMSVVPGLAAARQGQQQQQGAGGAGGGGPAGLEEAGAMEVDLWDEAPALLPTSQVFRVHALHVRKEGAALLPLQQTPEAALTPLLPSLRSKALELLTSALGGDALAAEYVLLCCCGGVFSRSEMGAHGLLPLNLTGCPAPPGAAAAGGSTSTASGSGSCAGGFVEGLGRLLEQLLPAVARLDASLAALNGGAWAPVKDYQRGRLARGALQLARGTLVVVDETEMAAGQVEAGGVNNLQALQSVIQQQQLPVDMQFYQHSLPTDLPVLILSTSRCLLKESGVVQVPLALPAPGSSSSDGGVSGQGGSWGGAAQAAVEALAPAELDLLRDYLLWVRGRQCSLPKEVAEALTQRYVELHAADEGFDGDRFSNCITVCKLLCVSHGLPTFDMAQWQRALELEASRLVRIPHQAAPQHAAVQPPAPAAGQA